AGRTTAVSADLPRAGEGPEPIPGGVSTVVPMASDPARMRRVAVLAGVVVAAVVAVVVLLGNGREPAVRAAATQRTAAEATSTAPGRGASGAASPSDGTGTPAGTTSPAATAGRTTTEPPAAGATAGPA